MWKQGRAAGWAVAVHMVPPPAQLDPSDRAALARARVWMDQWEGDSRYLEAARVEIERVLEQQPESAEAHRHYARYLLNDAMINARDPESKKWGQVHFFQSWGLQEQGPECTSWIPQISRRSK